MKDVLVRSARVISRRRVLHGAAAATFSTLAAASMGQPASAMSVAPCSGPHGTGRCGSRNCSGSNCRNFSRINCHKVAGYCHAPTNPCWRGPAGTCCDCRCHEGSSSEGWYCYCYG